MLDFLPKNARRFVFFLAALWCAGALGGCGAGSARNNNDPSQDLSRLEKGPSPEDIKAMQEAAKGKAGGPPPQAAYAAPIANAASAANAAPSTGRDSSVAKP